MTRRPRRYEAADNSRIASRDENKRSPRQRAESEAKKEKKRKEKKRKKKSCEISRGMHVTPTGES